MSCDVLYCACSRIIVTLIALTVLQCNSSNASNECDNKCTTFSPMLHNSHITCLDTHATPCRYACHTMHTMHATLCMLLSSAYHSSPHCMPLSTTLSCTLRHNTLRHSLCILSLYTLSVCCVMLCRIWWRRCVICI